MLTSLLLAAILAVPDAGHAGPLTPADFADPPDAAPLEVDAARAMAAALAADMDRATQVDALLATRAGQRIVNSALLCQSVQDLLAEGRSTAAARRRLAAIGVAATDRLERARIVPLPCAAYPIERLVGCLGILPGAECATDAEMATQVRAAERLESMP